LNALYAGLLAAAIILIQCLIGGTRLVFSLPAYGLIALACVASVLSIRRSAQRPSILCLLVTALFSGYVLWRAANSPWDYLWWMDFYQVIACLMVYGLITLYLTNPRERIGILGLLLVLAMAEFLIGVRQFRVGDDWMPFNFIRVKNLVRASGTLISPIHYAGFLEALAPFAFAIAFWSQRPGWVRALAGYVGLSCYAGVALSGSRGAWLSSLVSIVVFVLLSFYALRKTKPERFLGIALLTVGLAVAAVSGAVTLVAKNNYMQGRIELLTKQDFRIADWVANPDGKSDKPRATADIRVHLWQAGIDQFRNAPNQLFGTGAGTHTYFGRLYRRPAVQSDPIHVHSDYLEMLAEYGIIGLASIGVFIVVHLFFGMRRMNTILRTDLARLTPYEPARHDDLALLIGALSAVAAYLAHSLVDFNLHIPGNALFFAMIFGMLASPERALKSPSVVWEIPFRLALPGLGVWIAVMGLPKFPGEHWCEKARVAVRDRRFSDGVALARKALSYEMRNPDLYFHLGNAYRGLALAALNPVEKRAHLDSAISAFQKGLAIFPLDEHTMVRLAQSFDGNGRHADARALFLKAIEHDPNLGVLHAYFSQHLSQIGRVEEAKEHLQRSRVLGAANLARIVDQAFLDAPSEAELPQETP
jgi:O-antigen ligase